MGLMDKFPDSGQFAKEVLLLGLPSALLFGVIHDMAHSVFGAELTGISIVSVILGSLAVVGYVVNQELLDREVEFYQVAFTGLALLAGHYGLHYVLGFPAIAGVGTGVIVLTLVGYVLNYL